MPGRILVVDDVLPNVKLLEAKLAAEYFEVIAAMNGPQAIQLARIESPDLILLDVMMPIMDGFEVCRRLKADPATSHLPIVMVTALSDISDRVKGLEAGADDFLTKPVNDLALFSRVRSLVRLKTMMDEWRMREQTSSLLGVTDPAEPISAVAADRARILVVEVSDFEAQMLERTLSIDGNTLVRARTAREGQELALSRPFDVALVSLDLPDEDGLRLCSTLRAQERTRHLPLLLLADEQEMPRIAKALDLGVNDYLVQPVDRNEALARVRTQIRRRRFHERLKASFERSLALALTDSLTGLYNRRYLLRHLDGLVRRMADTGKPLSLLLIDVDHFKKVNDSLGHPAGDVVLRELARRMSVNLRGVDLIARLGGEEFVVAMPDTDTDNARLVAERLRQKVADEPFDIGRGGAGEAGGEREAGSPVPVTISIGLATASDDPTTPEELLRRADAALYQAKSQGRNRVCEYLPGESRSYVAAADRLFGERTGDLP